MSEPTSNDLAVSGGGSDDQAVGKGEHLHPLFLLSGLGGSLKGVGGAYAVLAYMLVSGRMTTALLMTVGILLVSLVAVYLYWRNFEYRVGANEIRIDSGILSRTHRSIPFDRIQDVDISQGPFARLVGIAKVKLETGASSGPKSDEGVLRAIALERAEELRSLVRSRRAARAPQAAVEAGEAAAEAPAEPVHAMGPRRLLLAGAFNFSLALFAGLFGLTQTLGDVMGFDPFSRGFWERALSAGDPIRAFILSNRLAAALAGIVVLVVVGVLTGVARTALRDWGFRLDRTEVGLRRRRGLITITDVTLPVRRVQAAILASGPVREALGFCKLKLQNLGHDEGGDHEVAPLATAEEANRILGELGWRPLPQTVDWARVSKAFVWGFLLALSPLLIPAAAAQVALAPLLGLAWLAVPLVLWLARHLEWTRLGYRLDGDRLLIRAGWWSRRTTILPLAKIQSIDLKESFISRLFGTASLHFGVAGATMFAGATIPAIPRGEARAVRDRLLGLQP
ncbi:MAG TPA: PH domain-containing protein [Sphingomicrobium sp.]|nr:PH domain-containing protein [Sphingomicrobium sp.]